MMNAWYFWGKLGGFFFTDVTWNLIGQNFWGKLGEQCMMGNWLTYKGKNWSGVSTTILEVKEITSQYLYFGGEIGFFFTDVTWNLIGQNFGGKLGEQCMMGKEI